MPSLPPPVENKTGAPLHRCCGLSPTQLAVSMHSPHSLPAFLTDSRKLASHLRTVFLNLLGSSSLYRESVSWLLHKLLVQFGGCARRNPLGTFLRWVGVGLPWSLINQQRCGLRLAHNNSSPASYKFCWNSKHYLPLVQKEGPFWGPSNIHSCLLCARQDVIRLPMQFTTWVRICDFLKSQGQEYF